MDINLKTGEVLNIKGPVAEGSGTNAGGGNSHAEGLDTIASGECSHAEGDGTTASGYSSHAEGLQTTASGYCSHAEGRDTTANGDYSHAEGENTIASGHGSHAEGHYTNALNLSEHAEGHFNVSHSAATAYGSSANTQHSVGIGTSAIDTKNAFEIMQNGDTYLYGVGGYDGTNPLNASTLQDYIPKALVLSSLPTTSITTIAGLEAIGLTAAEVQAAYNGLRTVVQAGGSAYMLMLVTYTDSTNFSINFGTVNVKTVGVAGTQYKVTSTNGTVQVTITQNT